MSSSLSSKYTLLYHPGIPGRGEFIRLIFEATNTKYNDVANQEKNGYDQVKKVIDPQNTGDVNGNPPVFAPPALLVHDASQKDLLLHQTPNILLYLGQKLNLAGSDEADLYHINQLALTALDLANETHDTHHPIAAMDYYENQKEAALKKTTDFRGNRIPKFFSYFERTLKGNEDKGNYLVGSKLSYADTTLWHVLDGLLFAFPKEMDARCKDFPLLIGKFYTAIKEEKWLQDYIRSGRRLEFSNGLFRRYPELDKQ